MKISTIDNKTKHFGISVTDFNVYADVLLNNKRIVLDSAENDVRYLSKNIAEYNTENDYIKLVCVVRKFSDHCEIKQKITNKTKYNMTVSRIGIHTSENCPIICDKKIIDNIFSDEKAEDVYLVNRLKELFMLSNNGCGLIVSAINKPEAYIEFETKIVNDNFISVNAYSNMSDIVLESGETRFGQDIYIGFGNVLERYNFILSNISLTHGSRTSKGAKCGWCSWYDLESRVSAKSVTATLDRIIELKNEHNYQFFQIDSGWQKSNGEWEPNEKFPDKFEKIVEKCVNNDIIPGIWVAPLIIGDNTPFGKEHPEVFIEDKNGNRIDAYSSFFRQECHFADPSHPETIKFAKDILKKLKKSGIRYFKIDFTSMAGCFYDKKKTSLQIYRNLFREYRETLGEDSYILDVAGYLNRGSVGYVDAARIGQDVCSCWEMESTQAVKTAITRVMLASLVNGKLYACDPDVTYLRRKSDTGTLTENEFRVWHSVVGLNSGIQMCSDPLQECLGDQIRDFDILCPPSIEQGLPTTFGSKEMCERFGFCANRPYGDFAVYSFINREDKPVDMNINISELNKIGKMFHIWSFWDEKYIGKKTAEYIIENLGARDAKILRFTPINERDVPLLIGSTFHISAGATEIENIITTAESIKIILNTSGANTGKLYIYNAEPKKITGNVKILNSEFNNNVLELELQKANLDYSWVEIKYNAV